MLILNDANFDTFTADKDTVLLEFYAPWWVLGLQHLLRWQDGMGFGVFFGNIQSQKVSLGCCFWGRGVCLFVSTLYQVSI